MKNSQLLAEVIESQPFPLMFLTISGAHLYGFPSENSDYDLRGVHILPLPKVIGLYPARETVEVNEVEGEDEIDLVTHDLKKFFTLLLKRNGYVLEQLYSPLILKSTPEHRQLKAIASGCITRNHYYHYQGFASNQWKLFIKENSFYIKKILYVYRALLTGINLLNTGRVEANLANLNQEYNLTYINDLIAQKQAGSEKETLSAINLDFYHQEYQRLQEKLDIAFAKSNLPEEPTAKSELNSLLLKIRK